MHMKLSGLIVRTLGSALVAAAAVANVSAGTLYEDYSAGIRRSQDVQSLGNDAFGETIDPYTGRVEFYVEDISIPGNSGLDISIGRAIEAYDTGFRPSYVTFASVSLNIPRLEGVFASGGWVAQSDTDYTQPNVNRCSALSKNPPEVDGSRRDTSFESNEYWHGNHLVIPGKTKQLMLEAGSLIPASYEWSTNQNWVFSCLPQTSNGVPGEGFLAFSPDGIKYYFDRVVSRGSVTSVRKPDTFGTSVTQLNRAEWHIYPSKVEDRFGNTLTYTYADDRLSEIASNDGRRLTFIYLTDGNLVSISDGSRTWQYSDGLRHVIYPDQSVWNMSVSGAFGKNPSAFEYYSCSTAPAPLITGNATITIDLPSGARGVFAFAPNRRGISYVGSQCGFGSNPGEGVVKVVDDIALTTKTITGPGLTSATWKYTPGPANDSFSVDCASECVATRTTQITNPDGSYVRNTYSNRKGGTEGDLLVSETYSASAGRMESTTYTYEYAQFANGDIGYPPPMAGEQGSSIRKALKSRITTLEETTLSWQALSYDGFARPLSVAKSSSTGSSMTEATSYYDDFSLWVVGQVKTVTCIAPAACKPVSAPNGIVTSQVDYGWKALPWKTYSFGKLQQTFSYDATSTIASGQLGTLKTVSDGRDGTLDTTITLSNWKRGIPQSIKYPVAAESPTGATQSAVVNDDGTIASITDENGYTTGYEYDDMGRLAKIVYPQEVAGTKFYNDTVISFVPTTAQFGLGAGHWAQVITQGAYRKITHFDALWRPMMVQEEGGAGTARFTAKAYDLQGNEAFNGYPQATAPVWNGTAWVNGTTSMKGTRATYDALNRIKRVAQDSELDLNQDGALDALVTTTDYLSNANGPYTLVTNPRTHQTRTWYQMFDQPDYSKPVMIWHPEGAYTHITRDVFGKPTRLRRSNSSSPTGGTVAVNRDYSYNANQELCRTDEPETGSSFMGYDAAGNLVWSASGYTTTAVGCVTASAVAARRVDRTYDGRNRIRALDFADGQGDTSYSYYPDGQLQSLVTSNDSRAVTSTYEYNRRRLLTRERLQWVNGSTTINWPIDYSYNANGHLAMQSWHGLDVDYAPNGLGQPTKAGTVATGVTYHPNGVIAQFTYGNGIVHKMTPNTRGLPYRSVDFYGSSVFYLDDYYDYDANGNVVAISDALVGNRGDRDMTYDGLDRLKTTVSAMYGAGGANYTYDVLDNLTKVSIGGTALRTHYYCYSSQWQLTFVRNGSVCTGTSASPVVQALEYDEQGNLKGKNSAVFNFDLGSRLRSVGPHTAPTSQYAYDGHGRRVWDRTTGDKYSHYTLDGRLSMTGDSRAGKVAEYIYLGPSLVAIRERDVPTNVYTYKYQHTDALGSPVRVTNAGRLTLERNEYEPYGKVIAPATPQDGPGYTGHIYDAATGMNYMQQRYYDPGIGRFLSVDPIGVRPLGDNFNRYWYANNNPYRFTDPDGRDGMETMAEQMAWAQPGYADRQQETSQRALEAFSRAINPFMGLAECHAHGCSKPGWGLAMVSVIPAGRPTRLVSRIDADGLLVREAQRAGRSAQSSLDALTAQLAKGNMNPGIGTKHLFNGIFEARARDGARVYFRRGESELEIVAKSTKESQDRVIERLRELYDKKK